MAHNAPGRHRAGRYNPFSELKLIAKGAAKPAAKAGAAFAATGGLIATMGSSAQASQAPAQTARPAGIAAQAATAVPTLAAAPRPQTVKTYKSYAYRYVIRNGAKYYSYKRVTTPKRYYAKRYSYTKRYTSRYTKRYTAKRYSYTSRYTNRYTTYRKAAPVKRYTTKRYYAPVVKRASYVAPRSTSAGARRVGYNPFPYGQCTYGAAEMWKRHTGYYPAVNGNALVWGGSARAAGYSVGYTPRANSIVVMQPGQGGSYGAGHVAWVNSANGNTINITEMNSSGRKYFTNRTLNGAGMQYIYA